MNPGAHPPPTADGGNSTRFGMRTSRSAIEGTGAVIISDYGWRRRRAFTALR